MKQKRGFTLVEMLISMGIMGFLLTILFQMFGSIVDTKLRSQATSAVAQDSRYMISRLSYDISRASDLSTLNANTLALTIDGLEYIYYLDNMTLMLSIEGGPGQAINGVNSKITALDFTQYADVGIKKSVQISLTIAPTIIQSGGATGERQLTTTVATR